MNPSLTGAEATLVAVVVADMDPVATLSTVTVLSSRQLQLTQGQVSEDPEEKERIIFHKSKVGKKNKNKTGKV